MRKIGSDRWLALFAAATWGFTMWSRTSFAYYVSETGISASQLGVINFVTSLGSMAGAIVLCGVADSRKWHMQVLAFGLFLSSIMQIMISSAASLSMIIAGRLFMGFGLGCVYSLSQAIVKKNSDPEKYSANAGIVENGEAVISTMLGPILIVQMISLAGWRKANLMVTLPVAVLAVGWCVLSRKKRQQEVTEDTADSEESVTFGRVLAVRNVRLCILLGILTLTNVWTMYTYAPMYWTQIVGFSDFKMSTIMTMAGVMAIGWCFVLPVVSDRFGRKKITTIFAVWIMLTYLLLALFPGNIFSICCYVIFAGSACTLSLFFMAMITTESVQPEYAASAISLVNASSEIFGGAVGPLFAGYLAELFDVRTSMLYAAGCMAVIVLLIRFLRETAPAFQHTK